jgi:hypothetical protein
MRQITLSCDPEWDDEVDVVCTDAGMAGLATAITAVDEDVDVFLAGAPVPEEATAAHGPPQGWFAFGDDEATAEYRRELTADLDIAAPTQRAAELPIRLAGEFVPVRQRPRPAFDGALLRDWNARCIAAPSGYLYSRVTDWTSAMMDCGGGELIKVTEVGTVAADADDPVGSVVDWLTAEAHERGVTPHPVRRFDRLVFDEGVVTGAIFSTDSGPLAVRARHGVLICRQQRSAAEASRRRLPDGQILRIALVVKDASRFGRVELLTEDAGIADVAVPSSPPASVTTSKS